MIRLPYRSPSPACPSGPSTSSSTAASTTVPALSVLPGAIVSRRFALNAKSPASAGDSANAETVTVTSSAVTRLSCAVTRLSPPSFEICSGANTRVTVGAPSSSVIVSVCGSGASRPAAPVAAALTRARRFGSSTSLSTAVTVTRPVLSVLPAAIVSSRFALNAKSSASAGDTGDAETVTVTSPVVAPLSCAVTRLSPPSSEIRSGDSASVTVGAAASSSVIVSLSAGGSVSPPGPVTAAVTVNRQRPVGAQLEVRRDRG